MAPDPASLELVPVAGGGTRLRLRVKPGARRSSIVGIHGGALKVAVTAPPERGRANLAVVALIAGALGLPASSIEMVSGEASRDKVVHLPLDAAQVRERLTVPLGGGAAFDSRPGRG